MSRQQFNRQKILEAKARADATPADRLVVHQHPNPKMVKLGRWSIKLPPEPQFDAAEHLYTDPETGTPIPSVTQILSTVGMKNEWGDEQSRKRGQNVHKAIHYDLDGDFDEEWAQQRSWYGYLEADRKFRKDYNWRSAKREFVVMSQKDVSWMRYAGRIDDLGLCTLNGIEMLGLRDVKSGKAPWWLVFQLTLYLLCIPDHRKYLRIGVELHEDGTYGICGPWTYQTWERDCADAMACLRLYAAYQRRKR